MKKWIAQRFKYTRILEKRDRLQHLIIEGLRSNNDFLEDLLDDYQERKTKFSKMTLDEAETLLASCVDYHRALKLLSAADPVQERVLHLFDKYGIKVERNTMTESVRDHWRRV